VRGSDAEERLVVTSGRAEVARRFCGGRKIGAEERRIDLFLSQPGCGGGKSDKGPEDFHGYSNGYSLFDCIIRRERPARLGSESGADSAPFGMPERPVDGSLTRPYTWAACRSRIIHPSVQWR
jgi:hypothetical protein